MGFESKRSEPLTAHDGLLQAIQNWKKNWEEKRKRERRKRWDEDHPLDAERREKGGYTVNGKTIYPEDPPSKNDTAH